MLLILVGSDPSLSITATLEASGNGRASWFGGKTGSAALLLLGTNLSWFFATLGGYPHLDARLMAVRSESDRKTAIIVSSIRDILAAIGTVLLSLVARTIHGSPRTFEANREMVLPFLVMEHTPDIVSGILLAGALAAMMSTADSQLVVASSAAAHDIYNKVLNKGKDLSEDALVRISRIGTLLVGAVGLAIAFWGDHLSKHELIAAFLAGPITTVVWITFGLTDIVTARLVAPPVGFAAAIIASLVWPRARNPHPTPTGPPRRKIKRPLSVERWAADCAG